MTEEKFACASCRHWKYVSVRVKDPRGRDVCTRCSDKAYRSLHAETLMVKNGNSYCSLAAQRSGAAKQTAKAYLKGFVPPGVLE